MVTSKFDSRAAGTSSVYESQQFKERRDGSVAMTLQVADDFTLRQWILGFGCGVRVLAPQSLAAWVVEQLEDARNQSGDGAVIDSELQPPLPYASTSAAT